MTSSTPVPGAKEGAGFLVRKRPAFATVDEERRYRLERLTAVCRVFGHKGFAEGVLGHVTVRDPGDLDLIWVNPLGVSFRKMRVSSLICVDHDGRTVTGEGTVNPVGLRLHAAIHEARPEVEAVCHAHSVYGKAWSVLGRPLDPITQDSCVFFDNQAIIREPRVTFDRAAASAFAEALGDKRMAIQVGHGLFTTGLSVDEAAWWFLLMDEACRVQLLAEAAGTPEIWPAPMAKGLGAGLGSPDFGWLSFQPFWDEISEDEPDLFL